MRLQLIARTLRPDARDLLNRAASISARLDIAAQFRSPRVSPRPASATLHQAETVLLPPPRRIGSCSPSGCELTSVYGRARPEAETRPLVHTETGVALGTVAYMSPEQLRGVGIDARSDIWSLGVVLQEMVTGRRPFHAPAHADLASSILRDDPAPLPPETPQRLRSIVARALSKEKSGRYGNISEMLAELRGLLRDTDDERATPDLARTAGGTSGRAPPARSGRYHRRRVVAVRRRAAVTSPTSTVRPAARIDSLPCSFRRGAAPTPSTSPTE